MSSPLTVLGWLWHDPRCRTQYTIEHVNIWARMIHRHLSLPHRFVLMTDYVAEFDPLIKALPLWDDYRELVAPGASAKKPQCYVRLKAFSAEARELIGERFVSIDLDCVVTGNLDPILSRPEDFVIWRRAPLAQTFLQRGQFQASIWMLRAGARPQVWEDFHGRKSLEALRDLPEAKDYLLAEQGWLLYKLGQNNEASWDMEDGIYDWRWLADRRLPDNARIVFFAGPEKPWHLGAVGWIRENYS